MSGRTVASLLALIALPEVAFAADPQSQKGPPAAPALVYSWNGVYLGSQFGYSFNEVSEQATDMTPGYLGASGVFPSLANPVFDAQSYLSKGLFTGVHVGYNKQFGSLVVGTEADVDFAGMHRAGTQFNMLAVGLGGPYGVNIQDNFHLSLRGRVGYAQDRSLYYLTGGLTNGGYTVQQNYWPLSAPTALTRDIFNIERFGWTLGGGVEYAIAGPWSARLEYRHSDFGAAVLASTAIPGLTFRERAAENSVSLGLTYHTEAARAETVAAPQLGTSAGANKPVFPLSSSLGGESSFMGRLVGAYEEEWGLASGPSDPNAPPGRRADFPPAPVTQPPYPFTEWAFGGANPIGATVPNSVDSPLMKALRPTSAGKFLEDNHIQVYGWINPGFNLSTARTQPGALLGGNWPAGYYIYPNQLQLDQVVAIAERLPDTVQKDHIDWGFRVSPIYGESYRYTTSFGLFSKQLTKWNLFAGYDMPMIYGELYLPWLAEGVVIRAGRFITLPDIEAQLAPNNYMYSHSMTYAFDGFTNTGVAASLQTTKNLMAQVGIFAGMDSSLWKSRRTMIPAIPGGQLYMPAPGVFAMTSAQAPYIGPEDPGIRPSLSGCLRYQTDDAADNLYLCANTINNGTYGYNNLQWYGGTFFHKFDENWHIAIEAWHEHENNVPNATTLWSPFSGGATGPFFGAVPSPFVYLTMGPGLANCPNNYHATCTAREWSTVAYLNYKFSPLDNISWRAEYFNDINGQRTGVKTAYFNYAMGWQHWFSPTIEIRPEIAFYNSLKASAFETLPPLLQSGWSGVGAKSHITVFSTDLLWHF